MAYWNDSGSAANVFDRLGSPGKWYGAVKCTNDTTTDFTGSNYGGAAILLNANGKAGGTAITTVGGDIITGEEEGNFCDNVDCATATFAQQAICCG